MVSYEEVWTNPDGSKVTIIRDENSEISPSVTIGKNHATTPSTIIVNSRIGENVKIGSGCFVEGARIGDDCRIGKSCIISKGIVIKEMVTIGSDASILLDTKIGREAEIGKSSYICGGVVIGCGSKIFDHSLAIGDIRINGEFLEPRVFLETTIQKPLC